MGQKDISEKILESFNEVFADIINVLIFDGKQEVNPADLEAMTPRSFYKADGQYREMERDVIKKWSKKNITFACSEKRNWRLYSYNPKSGTHRGSIKSYFYYVIRS